MSNGNGNTALATAPVVQRSTVMGSLADTYSMDPAKLLDTIKATCIKGGNATNEQVQAFLIVAKRYDLDPFLKEIYAFPAKGGGIVPIVGIDGWSKIANATGMVDGCNFTFEGDGESTSCTCTLHVKGRQQPTVVTEYMAECYRATDPWKQWPRRMLRHKAWIQCVRVAFGFGGIHDEDEARDIIRNENGTPTGAAAKVAAMNVVVRPHPTAETQVIDTSTANLPPDEVVEQHEPDVSGADAEPPPVDLSTYEGFVASLGQLVPTMPDDQFEAAMKQIHLEHKVKATGAAGEKARRFVYEAAENGALNWNTGKVAD